jgi:hypothetical protein
MSVNDELHDHRRTGRDLRRWIEAGWSSWTNTDRPPGKTLTIGGRKPGRQSLLVFGDKGSRPAVIVKLATDLHGRGRLQQEFAALASLHGVHDASMNASVPQPYEARDIRGGYAIAMQALPGGRLEAPQFTRFGPVQRRHLQHYIAIVDELSGRLASATAQPDRDGSQQAARVVNRFANLCTDGTVTARAHAFAETLGSSDLLWRSSWQHGDPSIGNILSHRGRAALVDWEDARPDHPSWLDTAMLPLAIVHMAAVQQTLPVDSTAVTATLGLRSRPGQIIRAELAARWTHPFPLSWAVTLACIHLAVRPTWDGHMPVKHGMEVASALLADPDCREQVSWATPSW